jgi:argininosuccinate lyase
MTAFNESLPYDRALHTADITGSKAYAQAIQKTGIITAHECSELLRGLDLVEKEWLEGKFEAKENDEDIHTANERRLGEIIGTKIAGKLHTGRSRNDQVATDMRIWLREEGQNLVGILKELIDVMITRAEKEIDVLLPGYTHLQVCCVRWKLIVACSTDSMGTFCVWIFHVFESRFTTSHPIVGPDKPASAGMWCSRWQSIQC